MSTAGDIPVHSFRIMPDTGIPFKISEFGQSCPLVDAGYPHRHDFYQIVHLREGEGVHFIDFQPHETRAGTLYFITPGQVHFWRDNKGLEGISLLFHEDFLLGQSYDLPCFHNIGKPFHLSLTRDQSAEILSLSSLVSTEYGRRDPERTAALQSYLNVLIITIGRLYSETYPPDRETADSGYTRRFKQLVSRFSARDHGTGAYAEKLGITAGHLNDIVKTQTGLSAGRIIRNEIALEAKRLLAHTDLTAAEISDRLGFGDPAYFGRFLKREIGRSPLLFRAEIREKYHKSPE